MKALVLELQAKALSNTEPVSDLLRIALAVAKKLKQEELINWILKEMNGYRDGDEIPSYRNVPGQVVMYNPFHGHVPVIFEDRSVAEMFQSKVIGIPISQIENLSKEKGLAMTLPKGIEETIMAANHSSSAPFFSIDKARLMTILDIVRNNILEWSLKLEAEGILGEGMTFSVEEKQTASVVNYNIGSVINSQVQQGTSHSEILHYENKIDKDYFEKFISEMKKQLKNMKLSEDEISIIKADVGTLESQLQSPKPNHSIIRQTITSIRTIVEGAAGSILSSEILKFFPVLMKMLS